MKMLHSMAAAALALAGGFSSEHHRGSTRRLFPRPSMAPQDSDRADPTKLGGVDRQAVLEAQAKRARKAAKARRDYMASLRGYHGGSSRNVIERLSHKGTAWAASTLLRMVDADQRAAMAKPHC